MTMKSDEKFEELNCLVVWKITLGIWKIFTRTLGNV